jgi:hypothetical protein
MKSHSMMETALSPILAALLTPVYLLLLLTDMDSLIPEDSKIWKRLRSQMRS